MPSEVAWEKVLRDQGDGAVHLRVRVVPRARRNACEGIQGDALKVRLTAPPLEGKANDALVAFLAECLNVPKRNVTIVQGQRSRVKVVAIYGLDVQTAKARLARCLSLD